MEAFNIQGNNIKGKSASLICHYFLLCKIASIQHKEKKNGIEHTSELIWDESLSISLVFVLPEE